jgi:hypothetical protein
LSPIHAQKHPAKAWVLPISHRLRAFFYVWRAEMSLKNLVTDLLTGWSVTVKKYSVQINAVNTAWQALAMAGVIPLDPVIVAGITLALTNLVTVAANASQGSIGTYDKTKYRLVAIEETA